MEGGPTAHPFPPSRKEVMFRVFSGRTLGTVGAVGATLAMLAACTDAPTDTVGPQFAHEAHMSQAHSPATAVSNKDLAALRRATARYHDVEAALADGYLADEHCVSAPPGGMGFHYVNPGYIDLEIDAARPEALLYEPTDDGGVRLVGAEFLVHGDAWDAENPSPPSFAGVAFDPPSDRSAAAPPGPFYTLHVWLWKHNPEGMFVPFNPRVSCG
jgi:hypothetical protein